MTAPLFHLAAGALEGAAAGATVTLTGSEARHAAAAMRLAPGESVLVADGSGRRGHGTVLAASPDAVDVRLDEVDEEPDPAPRLVLVQALAKGDRDLMAIQAAVELGVHAVVPWEAERSIVRWKGPKAAKARQKWADTAHAAAKQARRARVPEVREPVSGTGAASLAREGRVLLVLHEDAADGLGALPEAAWAGAEEIAVLVGPEGGISPAELDACRDAGAHPVRLGPHVLRASTAGPAALAVLEHRLGRW